MDRIAKNPDVHILPRSGDNLLVDKATGTRYPAAPAGSLLLSSSPFGWRGIIVEHHRLAPAELPEHSVIGHGLSINVGREPVPFRWDRQNGSDEKPMNPGECRLLTFGEFSTPRWLQTYEEISLILEPRFVAEVAGDHLAADRIEFATMSSAADSVIADYATAFRAELLGDASNGPLYAETLTVGLVLHLLANYGVAKPKLPAPRGKLNSFQLRAVLDCLESQFDQRVPLLTLARRAHVSPFHFARLFRATVGVPPHQFVLRLRIERALGLMGRCKMPLAQIAVECGFHDQAHFTRAFQRVYGMTPGYARGAACADRLSKFLQ